LEGRLGVALNRADLSLRGGYYDPGGAADGRFMAGAEGRVVLRERVVATSYCCPTTSVGTGCCGTGGYEPSPTSPTLFAPEHATVDYRKSAEYLIRTQVCC
jgi:hypothetical protein